MSVFGLELEQDMLIWHSWEHATTLAPYSCWLPSQDQGHRSVGGDLLLGPALPIGSTKLNGLSWESGSARLDGSTGAEAGTYEPEISDLLTELIGSAGALARWHQDSSGRRLTAVNRTRACASLHARLFRGVVMKTYLLSLWQTIDGDSV